VSIGLVKLSRRTESILDRTLRFFDEYRPINRSRCGVCGGSDSRASLLLASTCGYSQHRVRLRRPVRRQPMIVSADASPSPEAVHTAGGMWRPIVRRTRHAVRRTFVDVVIGADRALPVRTVELRGSSVWRWWASSPRTLNEHVAEDLRPVCWKERRRGVLGVSSPLRTSLPRRGPPLRITQPRCFCRKVLRGRGSDGILVAHLCLAARARKCCDLGLA
jgi:hypothetical protein